MLVPQRSGRIITLGSLAGQVGGLAAKRRLRSLKGGVIALTKSIATLLRTHGITANCVNPGIIDSLMTAGWSPDDLARLTAGTPLGRIGTIDEVAGRGGLPRLRSRLLPSTARTSTSTAAHD